MQALVPPEEEAVRARLRKLAVARDQAYAHLMSQKAQNGGRVPRGATEALGQACQACDRAGMTAVAAGVLTREEVKECLGE